MTGILNFVTGLVSGIGGLLGGGLTGLLNQLTDNLVTVALLVSAVALGLAHLTFSWLSRRRSQPTVFARSNGLARAAYRPAVRRF